MKKIQNGLFEITKGDKVYYIEELDILNLRVYIRAEKYQYKPIGIVATYKEAFNLIDNQ